MYFRLRPVYTLFFFPLGSILKKMNFIRRIVEVLAFLLLNYSAVAHIEPPGDERLIKGMNREVGHLRVLTLEPEKVEGEYRTAEGAGVYFLSEVKEESRLLLIATLQGEQLYRATSPRNKDTLVSLMGNDFLLKTYETTNGHVDTSVLRGFLVPEVLSVAEIERALDETDGIVERLLSGDDEKYSLSTMQHSLAKLHRSVEGALFTRAAEELGRDTGVLGTDYPAAMGLYVMAMRLTKDAVADFERVANAPSPHTLSTQLKCHSSSSWIYCSNSNTCCRKCTLGRDCLGMCDPGCTCWRWICGSCCFHQGCYDHDLCCETYLSWSCLSVWKFTCSSYSCK